MTFGTCRLCLVENVELRESHFVAKGFYKAAKKADGSGEDLLVLTRETLMQTSEQAVDTLLCGDCEDRFNKFGEKWTLAHACLANGTFPLREILRASKPGPVPKSATYQTDGIPAVKWEQLAYFGASLFWRGGVKDWHLVDTAPRLELGPYEENLRLYLLRKADLPRGVVLVVSVDGSDEALVSHIGTFPYIQNRTGDYRHFSSTLNGLRFDLIVGRSTPPILRNMCIVRAPGHPVFILENIGKLLLETYGKMRRGARAVGKIAKI